MTLEEFFGDNHIGESLEEYVEHHYLPKYYKIKRLKLFLSDPKVVEHMHPTNFLRHVYDHYSPEEIKDVYDMYRLMEL